MKFKGKETLLQNIRNTFVSETDRIQSCSPPGFLLLSPLFLPLWLTLHAPFLNSSWLPSWALHFLCFCTLCKQRPMGIAGYFMPNNYVGFGLILPLRCFHITFRCKRQGRTKIQMQWWTAARAAQLPQWFFQLTPDRGFTLPRQAFFSPSYPA